MRLVVDMNLSPQWISLLRREGFEADHWAQPGDARASDTDVMEWARQNQAVVLTNDLDFGAMLALTRAAGPSVIQMRTHDVSPARAGPSVLRALRQFRAELNDGALIVIDEQRQRIRILPLQR